MVEETLFRPYNNAASKMFHNRKIEKHISQRFLKNRENIFDSSPVTGSGFYHRVAGVGYEVLLIQVRKYFRSCERFQALYKEGVSGREAETLIKEKRKHRGARLSAEDHQKNHYDRSRIQRCQL